MAFTHRRCSKKQKQKCPTKRKIKERNIALYTFSVTLFFLKYHLIVECFNVIICTHTLDKNSTCLCRKLTQSGVEFCDDYFLILLDKLAIFEFNRCALMRGDTKSIDDDALLFCKRDLLRKVTLITTITQNEQILFALFIALLCHNL